MSLAEILTTRYSTRAFLAKEVNRKELTEILSSAQLSSSNCNVQPWQTMVVSGNTKDQLKNNLIAEISCKTTPNPEFDWLPKYKDIHRERQFGAANALYSAMGVTKDDKTARQTAMLRNWLFFDAPHVAFFCMPKYLGIMGAVDIGIYAQTLSLLLHEQGISSCMQGALGQFPTPIKQLLNIPDDIGVLFGMSFGYADLDAAANSTRTTRAKLSHSTKFFD